MTFTIDFDDRYVWNSKSTNFDTRPYSEITVHGPSGSTTFFALVDSGADYTQLGTAVAGRIGINLASGTPHPISSASGSATLTKVDNLKLTIEGVDIDADVLFGPNSAPALLGRTAFSLAIDFGIDDKGWLHRKV